MNIVKLRQDFYRIEIATRLIIRSPSGTIKKDKRESFVFRAQPDITITKSERLEMFYESVLAGAPNLNSYIGHSDVLDRCLMVYLDHLKKTASETEPFEVGTGISVSGAVTNVTRCEDYEMTDLTPAFKNMTIRFYLERK